MAFPTAHHGVPKIAVTEIYVVFSDGPPEGDAVSRHIWTNATLGMKAHIGVDAESGLVHTVRGTSGNISDIAEANSLLHGQESVAYGDAGYQGVEKRPDATKEVTWHVAMRPGKRRALDKENEADARVDKAEKLKAGIRAKVEHPFRVIKRQFGHVKVRYRGLKKNTAQLITLLALPNLWMVRGELMGAKA